MLCVSVNVLPMIARLVRCCPINIGFWGHVQRLLAIAVGETPEGVLTCDFELVICVFGRWSCGCEVTPRVL